MYAISFLLNGIEAGLFSGEIQRCISVCMFREDAVLFNVLLT